MNFPLKVSTHVSALNEAQEMSVTHPNEVIYLFKVLEGGYVIDNQSAQYSNEKLIVKLKDGKRL